MRIIGTGSAVPELAVTNDMLAQFLDTNDEWITTRTGIKQRRIISSEKLEDLAAEAARKALENAHMTANDLDFILCSNVINEYVTPGLGCVVQGLIGASCPCLDLNGACAGFIYALDIAEAYIKSGRVNNILVVAAEEPTRMVDWSVRNTSVLFGDGAGAVVLTKGDNMKGIRLSTVSKTHSLYEMQSLNETPFDQKEKSEDTALTMDGKDVFRMAVNSSLSDINGLLTQEQLGGDDINHYLLHQANIRIIDTIRQALNQKEDKFHHNIEKYGNTSSASIPILLDELNRSNVIKEGDKIVMSAFGAGFTTGACLLQW